MYGRMHSPRGDQGRRAEGQSLSLLDLWIRIEISLTAAAATTSAAAVGAHWQQLEVRQAKALFLATTAVETQGKGAVLATEAAPEQRELIDKTAGRCERRHPLCERRLRQAGTIQHEVIRATLREDSPHLAHGRRRLPAARTATARAWKSPRGRAGRSR